MRYSDIVGKQVINIRNGALIGTVCDLAFDPCSYLIYAIYACPPRSCIKKCFPFFFPTLESPTEIEIDVKEIENIQGDVILVRFS